MKKMAYLLPLLFCLFTVNALADKAAYRETAYIRLNVALHGYPAGTILQIQLDKNGKPVDGYWANRLRDAAIDNCITFVTN